MSHNTPNELLSRHEKVLHDLLNTLEIPAKRIKEAIAYTLFPGGKRLRPMLVYLCGRLIDVPLSVLDIIAASIEFTHCYSLIHDDLPAMDNDDFRRGKPSCHKAFDEATAILAGDAMQILAIDLLVTHLPNDLGSAEVISITKELVRASGPAGMISGQSLDLTELKNAHIEETELRNIHLLKTGKLISSCINMVIAAGNPPLPIAGALRQFAHHFGLVFQMQDDYLDHYKACDILGKHQSSDLKNEKTTFATLYGQDELIQLINEHYQQVHNALSMFGKEAQDLIEFIVHVQNR